jgi:hypothetical protein
MSRKTVIAAWTFLWSCALASAAIAGDGCRICVGAAAGAEVPCGDSGCGPRYWGAVFEELPWRDPCDCSGKRKDVYQGVELLAPWQAAPCRGFVPPRHMGYSPTIGVCDDPGTCHPCTKGSILGFRPGPLWWF